MSAARPIIIAAALLAISAGATSWLMAGPATQAVRPVWSEVAWPFPIDEWGLGKAYRCQAASCGAEINVYLRGKIGFCNCTTGVADDIELDRLSDFNLLGGKAAALAEGQPVTIGWMKGRSRSFALPGLFRHDAMTSVAFSNECDALVATAVGPQSEMARQQPRVMEFLNSDVVLGWAKAQLSL